MAERSQRLTEYIENEDRYSIRLGGLWACKGLGKRSPPSATRTLPTIREVVYLQLSQNERPVAEVSVNAL